MLLGWRPHDLATAYLPFIHGVGSQVALSDPVFMAKYGLEPIHEAPEFPYDPQKFEKLAAAGDEKAKQAMFLGIEWMKQINTGIFKTWAELKLLRENWDGPIIIKGILSVKVSPGSVSLGDLTLTHRSSSGRGDGSRIRHRWHSRLQSWWV